MRQFFAARSASAPPRARRSPPPRDPARCRRRQRPAAERSDRDMRRKRPPALSFLLRWSTLRRVARVLSLLALDFAGVFARDLHGAAAEGSRAGQRQVDDRDAFAADAAASSPSPTWSPCCCSRARACTPTAAQRPGLARIVATLFQVTRSSRCSSRSSAAKHFPSFYIFYGSLFFALLYVVLVPRRLRAGHRRAAARRRLPAPRGARRHRQAHPRRRPRARATRPHAPIEVVGFISRDAAPANGLRSLGTLAEIGATLEHAARRRGDHRRPRLPRRRERSSSSTACHARGRARADRAVDDGDPDPPRGVRPGPVGAAVRAAPAGLRGHRLRAQAHLRPDRRDARC